MKIAASSASFATAIAAGDLTQLEWLDVCAAELEADGVVFDVAQFPRRDVEYLAQLKKLAIDLGLSVGAVAAADALGTGAEAALDLAAALGAPVVVAPAPYGDGAEAWQTSVAAAAAAAAEGKRRNITLAVRQAAGTVCPDVTALKRLVKEVDSAWLRFAPDPGALGAAAAPEAVLEKAPLAVHAIVDIACFASESDAEAANLVRQLRRFRGFLVLERPNGGADAALHGAFERFRALRLQALLR